MYDQFVELYDFIFPLKQIQRKFVIRHSQNCNRILDIGCSTGTLAASLVSEFTEVVAIDYSSEMIKKALTKNGEVSYLQGDMLSLSKAISGEFDTITCFGNTLVHLHSTEEISSFFNDVKTKLSNGGQFLFQILRYDNILKDRPATLPIIDNKKITFTRFYHYESLPYIRFETKLLDKNSGTTIVGEVQLLAVDPESIRNLLFDAGFTTVSFFGSFNDDPFTSDSFPLVVKAS